MSNFQVGDTVKVHKPSWHDATGCTHGPGRWHGALGTVEEVTDGKVGNDRLYMVRFSGSSCWPEWTSDLRKAEPTPAASDQPGGAEAEEGAG